MKTVKQESEKLLRVMLSVSGERGRVAGYLDFEVSRSDAERGRVGIIKEVSKEIAVGPSKVAFGAQGIVGVELFDVNSIYERKEAPLVNF